jgi:hypothetical protein
MSSDNALEWCGIDRERTGVDDCDLRQAVDGSTCECDGVACVYWRVVEQIGDESGEGCAIRHYELLGDSGVATWLLSVKTRLESKSDDAGPR